MPRRTPERRDLLIDQVIDHLIRHGAADLSLRPLAAALGVSTFSLSYHFGSKEALLETVITALQARQTARVEAILSGIQGGPEVAVRAVWTSCCDHLEEDRLIFEAALSQRLPIEPSLRARLTLVWVETVVAILTRFGFSVADAQAEATLLTAVLVGLEIDLLTTGDRARVDATAGFYADLAGARWRARRPS